VREILNKHSVKISFFLSILVAILAQTPVEYGISGGLFVMALWDLKDGKPFV